VTTADLLPTLSDGLLEWNKFRIAAAMKAFGFDKLPQAVNEVKIGGIRGHPEPGDVEALRWCRALSKIIVMGRSADRAASFSRSVTTRRL
jgi:hypothetical protein